MVWPCNLTRRPPSHLVTSHRLTSHLLTCHLPPTYLPASHLPPCHFPFCQLPASPQIEDVASNCKRASTVYETDQEKDFAPANAAARAFAIFGHYRAASTEASRKCAARVLEHCQS